MHALPIRFHFKFLHLAFILLLAGTASAAEWYKEYETAIDLIRKGRYGEAIPRLQSAISQKNQEGLNIKFYGMKFDDYVPHYYLGRAYFQQKNYDAALRELDVSLSQGEIQRNRGLFQNLTELKTLASAQLNLQQPAQPPVVAQKKPEPVQPKPDPPVLTAEKKPDSQPAIRETTPPKPEPAIITKTEPVPPPPVPPAESQEELNQKRAKAYTKEGARRYFQGEFDSAISSFSSALRLTPRDLSAQFLLGCSYAAKYLLSGSSDQQSLQKASAAFEKIRQTNPNYPLTKSQLISPAVRQIYEKSGGG